MCIKKQHYAQLLLKTINFVSNFRPFLRSSTHLIRAKPNKNLKKKTRQVSNSPKITTTFYLFHNHARKNVTLWKINGIFTGLYGYFEKLHNDHIESNGVPLVREYAGFSRIIPKMRGLNPKRKRPLKNKNEYISRLTRGPQFEHLRRRWQHVSRRFSYFFFFFLELWRYKMSLGPETNLPGGRGSVSS